MTEDEMVGWHHRLKEHEFEQAPGGSEGQGSLVYCSPRSLKESDQYPVPCEAFPTTPSSWVPYIYLIRPQLFLKVLSPNLHAHFEVRQCAMSLNLKHLPKELMLSNCGAGEDSGEFLGLQ